MTIDRTTGEWSVVARQQAAIGRLGQRGLEGVSLDHLLAEAAELVAVNLGVQSVAVFEWMLSPGHFRVRAVLHQGSWVPRSSVEQLTVGGGTHSQAGYTLLTGEPVVASDLEVERRFVPADVGQQAGVRSGVTAIIG